MTDLSQAHLLGLYVSQGAPAGFHTNLVPLLFREWKQSYRLNALAQLSYLPWVLKPLIAPQFEHATLVSVSKALFISGLIQLLLYVSVNNKDTQNIIYLLFAANVSTALYDIFVDKLAIKHRSESDLDFANVFQVVGYKLGLMLTGGLVMYFTSHYYSGDFNMFALSPLISATLLMCMSGWTYLTAAMKAARTATTVSTNIDTAVVSHEQNVNVPTLAAYRLIYAHLKQHIPMYVLLFTYKTGETIGDSLFKPFLKDNHFDLKSLSNLGIMNEVVSILGSLTMVRNKKHDRKAGADMHNLRKFLLLNIIPQCLRALVVCYRPAQQFLPVAAITLIEHFIGGAVTVACFNFMFSNVIERIEGTHYAVFSAIEVLGKIFTSFCANYVVEWIGFQRLFVAGIFLSFLPVLLCALESVPGQNAHHHEE